MAPIFAPGTPVSRKALLASGAICLFACLPIILYGLQATTLGTAGLHNHGILGFGFALSGVALLLFSIAIARDAWFSRPRGKEAIRAWRKDALRETGLLAASAIIYLGGALVALGILASFDTARSMSGIASRLVFMAACIASIVAWRRAHKKHPRSYDTVGPLVAALLMAGIVALGLFGGTTMVSECIADKALGPQTARYQLSDVEKNRPSGRYRGFSSTTYNLKFTSLENGTVRWISVSEDDVWAIEEIIDSGGAWLLTYYPCSGVFVSAEPL